MGHDLWAMAGSKRRGAWKEGFLEEEAPFLASDHGAEHLRFQKTGRALMLPWVYPSRSCRWGGKDHPFTEKKVLSLLSLLDSPTL